VDLADNTVQSLQINSVLDVGCGDWEMWPDYQFQSIKYAGIDVVNEAVDTKNTAGKSKIRSPRTSQ